MFVQDPLAERGIVGDLRAGAELGEAPVGRRLRPVDVARDLDHRDDPVGVDRFAAVVRVISGGRRRRVQRSRTQPRERGWTRPGSVRITRGSTSCAAGFTGCPVARRVPRPCLPVAVIQEDHRVLDEFLAAEARVPREHLVPELSFGNAGFEQLLRELDVLDHRRDAG